MLRNVLTTKFEEIEDDNVKFKQWKKEEKNKTNLLSLEMSAEEFIVEICRQIEVIRKHHFIAKSQANFLQELKSGLKENEVLILLDFAEKYSFAVQDAVQGYHWNNSQATLHHFVAYHLNCNTLVSKIFCVISDEMKHDTTAVHKFMSVILPQTKRILPYLIKWYHFSNGAGFQYKNYKNFANLCHHKADFGNDAKRNFFATSHGKGPCDVTGGTVKHLVARASLQMVSGQTITSLNEIFTWCKENISCISSIYVSADVEKHSILIGLEKCYKSAYKILSLFHIN